MSTEGRGSPVSARRIADAIQERKHSAQLATAQCAADCDWDLETYWRARAEGLAQAESIARGFIEEEADRG